MFTADNLAAIPLAPAAPPATPPTLARHDWIAGLQHGLALLECFDDQHERLTAATAGALAGLTRTAARRHLLTLQHLGYLASDGKQFWLTPRVLGLGQRFLDSSRLARVAQPFLARLAAGTQEIAYVSMLDGDDLVFIARNGPNRAMNTGFVLGARCPAQVTAAGRLMLAHRDPAALDAWFERKPLKAYTSFSIQSDARMRLEFERIRREGYAVSEQQLELHFRGIAVGIRNAQGALVGGLSVSMPMAHESTEAAVARVLPLLKETAMALRGRI